MRGLPASAAAPAWPAPLCQVVAGPGPRSPRSTWPAGAERTARVPAGGGWTEGQTRPHASHAPAPRLRTRAARPGRTPPRCVPAGAALGLLCHLQLGRKRSADVSTGNLGPFPFSRKLSLENTELRGRLGKGRPVTPRPCWGQGACPGRPAVRRLGPEPALGREQRDPGSRLRPDRAPRAFAAAPAPQPFFSRWAQLSPLQVSLMLRERQPRLVFTLLKGSHA